MNGQGFNLKKVILPAIFVVIFVIAVILLAVFFQNDRKNQKGQENNSDTAKMQTGKVPEEIASWRLNEKKRLDQARQDQALFQEILSGNKNVEACAQMVTIDGVDQCFYSIAVKKSDEKICENIKSDDYKKACQENFKANNIKK